MDAKILHELFEYRDGELYWKVNRYRVKSLGKLAGWIENTGYRRVLIDGKKYQIHRLVYMMHYGFMPKTIDHLDGNRLNNKIENLRPATIEENCRNSIKRTNNTSGVKGVFWNKQTGKPLLSSLPVKFPGKLFFPVQLQRHVCFELFSAECSDRFFQFQLLFG